jgi:hypothetical protein
VIAITTAIAIALSSVPALPSPATAIRAALEDARKLADPVRGRPATLPYTRYLSLYNVPPAERADVVRWLTFWLWSLSREADPLRPRWVRPDLVAIDLRDYGIDPYVYGRLAAVDPYFHLATTVDGVRPLQEGLYATWLPTKETAELALLLGPAPGVPCATAVLRADWFVVQTSIQDGRGKVGEGTGYYDFLGIRSREDFHKLVGFDARLAAERKAEWRAIVESSGVSYFPRQIVRAGAVDAGYWFTLDALDDARGARNALRKLDRDYEHQAEEHYGVGPSGLFMFLLTDAKGALQDSAPDKIGPDKTRQPHNRTRIEVGASCVRCHFEGLRPIDSWAKDVLQAPAAAVVGDAEALRIRRLYFRDLEAHRKRDNLAYADRLRECNGLSPAANAKLFARMWDGYTETRLTIGDCARELGTSPERLLEVLLAVRAQGKLDPAFAGLVAARPRPISRAGFEEVYPAAQLYLGGQP